MAKQYLIAHELESGKSHCFLCGFPIKRHKTISHELECIGMFRPSANMLSINIFGTCLCVGNQKQVSNLFILNLLACYNYKFNRGKISG